MNQISMPMAAATCTSVATPFSGLGLAEPILRAVAAEGYTTPTPIQSQAIPVVLASHDLLGIAQTGTGKTAAFVLPMLQRLADDRVPPRPRTCRVLVLAPTRELAAQIAEAVRTYGRHMTLAVAVVVGGVRPGPQIRQLARGVDVLVATPGRLLDHMGTNAVRLDECRTVVLDEADQMLDLGFMPAIRRILAKLPKARQTLLFSATMPTEIRKLADDFLHMPREVRVTPAARPVDAIDQRVIMLDTAAKRAMLASLLGQPDVGRAIVFTRTKHGADRVCRQLGMAGIEAAAIHGNKSQSQRERALDAFRGNRIRILIATDIAARGIDVDGITHVVNYELPDVPEVYVHRIGRTARAGATGIAIAFCDASERTQLRDIERLIGRSLPKQSPDGIPARQLDHAHADRRNTNDRRKPARRRRAQKNAGKARHGLGNKGRGKRTDNHKTADRNGGGHAAPMRRPRERRNADEAADAGLARMLGL